MGTPSWGVVSERGMSVLPVAVVAMQVASATGRVPVSLNVVVSATSLVYFGALRSLVLLSSDSSSTKAKRRDESVTLTAGDAMRFPLVGAATLLTMYGLIEVFGKVVLNWLFGAYFSIFGAVSIASTIEAELESFGGGGGDLRRYGCVVERKWFATLFGEPRLDLRFGPRRFFSWLIASLLMGVYSFSKHWLLNNCIGACLCLSGLELISVGSFRNACVLLGGLFVYDVAFVFGTEVMVTVAKGVDGPVKLLFVREASGKFSMLGLGDVVVPGLAVAMLLRFDASLKKAKAKDATKLDDHATWLPAFPAPYFVASLVAYVLGLASTLVVMNVFDAAQPALLYLVPAVLGVVLALAWLRGELGLLTAYTEGTVEDTTDKGAVVPVDDDANRGAAAPSSGEKKSSFFSSSSTWWWSNVDLNFDFWGTRRESFDQDQGQTPPMAAFPAVAAAAAKID